MRKVASDLGIETKWTLAAEAREYRETLAIRQTKGKVVQELPPMEHSEDEPAAKRGAINPVAEPVTQAATADSMESALQTAQPPPAMDGIEHTRNGGQQIPAREAAEREVPEQQQESAATKVAERAVPCPKCKGPLAVSTLKAGRNECPHCGVAFNVKR